MLNLNDHYIGFLLVWHSSIKPQHVYVLLETRQLLLRSLFYYQLNSIPALHQHLNRIPPFTHATTSTQRHFPSLATTSLNRPMAVTPILKPIPTHNVSPTSSISHSRDNILATSLTPRLLINPHIKHILDIPSRFDRIRPVAPPIGVAITDGKALIYLPTSQR